MNQSPSSPPLLFLIDLSLFQLASVPTGSSSRTAPTARAKQLITDICTAIDRVLFYSPNGTECAFHTFDAGSSTTAPRVYPLQPFTKVALLQLRKAIAKRALESINSEQKPIQLTNLTAAAEQLISVTGEPSYDSFLDSDKSADRKLSLFLFSNAPSSRAAFANFAPSMDEASAPNVSKTRPLISNPNRANLLWVNCSSSSTTPGCFHQWLSSQNARFVSLLSLTLDRQILPARISVGSITRPVDKPAVDIKTDFLIPPDEQPGDFVMLFRGSTRHIVTDFKPLSNIIVVARHFISKSDENLEDQDLHNAGGFLELPRFVSPGFPSNQDPKTNKVWAEGFAGLLMTLQNTRCRLAVDVYEVNGDEPQRARFGIITPITPVSASLRLVSAAAVGQMSELSFQSDAFNYWKNANNGASVRTSYSARAPAPIRGKRIVSSFPNWMPSSFDTNSESKLRKESLGMSEILDLKGSKVSKSTSDKLVNYAKLAVDDSEDSPPTANQREDLRGDILKSLHEQLRTENELRAINVDPPECVEVSEDVSDVALPSKTANEPIQLPEDAPGLNPLPKPGSPLSIEQAISDTIAAMNTYQNTCHQVQIAIPTIQVPVCENPTQEENIPPEDPTVPAIELVRDPTVSAAEVGNTEDTHTPQVVHAEVSSTPPPHTTLTSNGNVKSDVVTESPIPGGKQNSSPMKVEICQNVTCNPEQDGPLEASESDAAIIEQLASETVNQPEMFTQMQPFKSLIIAPSDTLPAPPIEDEYHLQPLHPVNVPNPVYPSESHAAEDIQIEQEQIEIVSSIVNKLNDKVVKEECEENPNNVSENVANDTSEKSLNDEGGANDARKEDEQEAREDVKEGCKEIVDGHEEVANEGAEEVMHEVCEEAGSQSRAESAIHVPVVPINEDRDVSTPNQILSSVSLLLEAANVSNELVPRRMELEQIAPNEHLEPLASIEALNNEPGGPQNANKDDENVVRPPDIIPESVDSDGEADVSGGVVERTVIDANLGLMSDAAQKVKDVLESLRDISMQKGGQRRLNNVKALVRKCMLDLSHLSEVAMSEGRERHDVRKAIRKRAGRSDSVCDELKDAHNGENNATNNGVMVDRDISPALWYVIMKSFEQIIWLSASTTFYLRKRSHRKRSKKLAKRVRSLVSVTQITGQMDASKPDSRELFEECFSALFESLLNPFIGGLDEAHPGDWLVELKDQYKTEAWFQSPDKSRKPNTFAAERQKEDTTAPHDSQDSGSKSRKRRLEILEDDERFESRESMRKSARKLSRTEDDRRNSGGKEKSSLGELVSKLKEKKVATTITGRDRFSTVENRIRTGSKSQTKLAIKLDIKKLGGKQRSSKSSKKDKERNKRVDALFKNMRRNAVGSDAEKGEDDDDEALFTDNNPRRNDAGTSVDGDRSRVLVEETPTKPTHRDIHMQRFQLDESVEDDEEGDPFICLSPGDDEEEDEMFNAGNVTVEASTNSRYYNGEDDMVVPETPL